MQLHIFEPEINILAPEMPSSLDPSMLHTNVPLDYAIIRLKQPVPSYLESQLRNGDQNIIYLGYPRKKIQNN